MAEIKPKNQIVQDMLGELIKDKDARIEEAKEEIKTERAKFNSKVKALEKSIESLINSKKGLEAACGLVDETKNINKVMAHIGKTKKEEKKAKKE